MLTRKCLVWLVVIFSAQCLADDYKKDYSAASAEYGVPKQVLYAIGLKESGITTSLDEYRPWPYTLNIYGKDYRFNSLSNACTALTAALKKTEAIDIGETQLHWKYQKVDGVEPCDYFDRRTSLKQTSVVLLNCYKQHQNWVSAAGCYHFPKGGVVAEKYMRSYANILESVIKEDW
ncbi:glucosaminidase domain-containing protein [Vibrio fluvialis]|uniref:glucosaminidase domain-containing protein n=1 Tax=Vibrio fluvialis TaxID=676 RepID=UPI00192C4850|nr:glucosaminidase domain-containing protein [Vibrio fluvialis]MBL4262804.1 glucosaminidase domain-containing protein [Vibrio fluvialis]